jgi:hypothetical protein
VRGAERGAAREDQGLGRVHSPRIRAWAASSAGPGQNKKPIQNRLRGFLCALTLSEIFWQNKITCISKGVLLCRSPVHF